MNSKVKMLIKALSSRNDQNTINWSPTKIPDKFQLKLDLGTIELSKYVNVNGEIVYEFVVYNKSDNMIWRSKSTNTNAITRTLDYEMLKELHKNVMENYLKLDITIESIIKEIKLKKNLKCNFENKIITLTLHASSLLLELPNVLNTPLCFVLNY